MDTALKTQQINISVRDKEIFSPCPGCGNQTRAVYINKKGIPCWLCMDCLADISPLNEKELKILGTK